MLLIILLGGIMDKFCGQCGALINTDTGHCENCYDIVQSKQTNNKKGAIVLTSLFCIFVLLFMTVSTVKLSLTDNSLYGIADKVQYTDICEKITVYDENGDERRFNEYLKEYFKTNIGITIEDESLSDLIDKSTIKNFFALQAYIYTQDLFYNSQTFRLSSNDVFYLLKNNKALIVDKYNVTVSDDVLLNISEWIVDDKSVQYISPMYVKYSFPVLTTVIQIVFSPAMLFVLVLCIIIILFMFFKKYKQYFNKFVGYSLIAVSMFFILIGLLLLNVFSGSVILYFAGLLLTSKLLIYVLILTIGVLLAFYKPIIRLLFKKER